MNESPSSPADWLSHSAADRPGRIAAVEPGGVRLDYAALRDRVGRLTAVLVELGLRRGDRVATLGRNSVDQVVTFFACAGAGLVVVPLSWRAAPAELASVLEDAKPALLLTGAEHEEAARRAAELVEDAPPLARLEGVGAEEGTPLREAEAVDLDDPLLLIYTSGSTGKPKGVPLTHRNCWATNRALEGRFPLTPDDVVLMMLPQFHIGAWNVQPLLAWAVGARVVILPAFDPGLALDALEREQVTTVMGVPTTYRMLAEHPGFAGTDLAGLRTVLVGGAPLDSSVRSAWTQRGVRLTAGYGLTEAGPNVLCEPDGAEAGTGMVPYPGVRVALRDAGTGRHVTGPGTGELLVRGVGVFPGYWGESEPTERLSDGWLVTGDVAARTADGTYHLVGRTGEMFISGGENVHPREVEDALLAHPAVAATSVVGVPDPSWGEVGVAFVVLRADRETTEEELRAHCRAKLAGFKVPRRVVVTDELPLTGSGKIDKRVLRARIEGRL